MVSRVALNSGDGSGVHRVYRYPARFPSSVARWAIERFTRAGDTVYDPYMGSGTTALEAVLLERHAVGCDVNPFAVWLTRTKLALPDAAAIPPIYRAWLDRWGVQAGAWHSEWNAQWYDPSDYQRLCGLRRVADCPVTQLLFLRVARAMAHMNPRSGKVCRARAPQTRDLHAELDRQCRLLLTRLRDWQPLPPRVQRRVALMWADACTVEYPPVERPQLVVTSPPYLNAYDYLAWCRLEIEWLAAHAYYDHARRLAAMPHAPETAWERIAQALQRAWDTLKTGGYMVIIVGATVVKGERFDTPARVERAIHEWGGTVRERHTRPVRSAIGHRRDAAGRFVRAGQPASITTYPEEQVIVACKTHG